MNFTIAKPFSIGGSSSVKLLLFLSLMLSAVSAHPVDIVAITQSGRRIVIGEVETRSRSLELSIRGTEASLADPVVDIEGLELLPDLADLRIYHAPQLADFAFLAKAPALEKLVISFARVRDIGFLSSLPLLRFLMLEFCDDWENRAGLPFIEKPLDLTNNQLLEFIGFRVCGLQTLPRFWNAPGSLQYLDLSYNDISLSDPDSASLTALSELTTVYVRGNEVSDSVLSAYPGIVLDNADSTIDGYLE